MALVECLGGPLDGRLIDSKEGDVVRVIAPRPVDATWLTGTGLEFSGLTVKYHTYCLRSRMDGSAAYRYEGVR